jgi:hypothetical protein
MFRKVKLLNLIYLISGTLSVAAYINLFYRLFDASLNLPKVTEDIIAFIFLIPWSIFYLMGLTFTILLHPIIIMIIFIRKLKRGNIETNYIIIFIWSMAISITYIYLIWGEGLILTA